MDFIKSYDTSGNLKGTITEYRDLQITEEISKPNVLEFEVLEFDNSLVEIGGTLLCDDEIYRVSEINKSIDGTMTSIYAVADITALKGLYYNAFSTNGRKAYAYGVQRLLEKVGWACVEMDTFTRTKRYYAERKSGYDVLLELAAIFGYELKFSAKDKRVYVYKYIGSQSRHKYLLEGYNLEKFEQSADVSNVANRVHAYGKDGLRFQSRYVDEIDDLGFDNYTIGYRASAVLEDKDEQDNESLRTIAMEYLRAHRLPTFSYTASALDLKAIDSSAPDYFDVKLGDLVIVKTQKFGSVDLRAVKITRYPNEPWRTRIELSNKVELSTTATLSKVDAAAIAESTKPINSALDKIKSMTSSENSWLTTRNDDVIHASRRFIETLPVTASGSNYVGPMTLKMLPYPMTDVAFAGSSDWQGTLVNTSAPYKTYARYRYLFTSATVGSATQLSCANSIIVSGKRATPPSTPTVSSKTKRAEAIEVCESYFTGNAEKRLYGYGPNFISYSASNVVNDDKGRAMMECDTFVSLVLMGIKYDDTPYANKTAGLTYDFANLNYNPHGYTWTLPLKNTDPSYILVPGTTVKMHDISTRKITYTGLMNFLFWSKNMVFSSMDSAQSGDVVIFTDKSAKYFDEIAHIGIVERKSDGTLWIYHITYYTNNHLEHEPLADVLARTHYKAENMYFARIDYA